MNINKNRSYLSRHNYHLKFVIHESDYFRTFGEIDLIFCSIEVLVEKKHLAKIQPKLCRIMDYLYWNR